MITEIMITLEARAKGLMIKCAIDIAILPKM
jgi:hypothetical protein